MLTSRNLEGINNFIGINSSVRNYNGISMYISNRLQFNNYNITLPQNIGF